MDVIPITLAISLLLAVAFVALFWRERSRGRQGSPERDSLQPFAEELGRPLPRKR